MITRLHWITAIHLAPHRCTMTGHMNRSACVVGSVSCVGVFAVCRRGYLLRHWLTQFTSRTSHVNGLPMRVICALIGVRCRLRACQLATFASIGSQDDQ